MDFFAAQARARRQSRLLGWGFALCLLAVVFALNVIVLTALRIGYATGRHPEPFAGSLADWALLHPGTVLLISLLTGGFIGVASLTRMLQLREGGGYVARSVGGVRVDRSTQDAKRRMLHNIVDEMALASGVPAPEVYVLEKDDAINAFAAGHTPANAAVTVTRGALRKLNRDQLQGVVAHEFSHILNGDMRLSIRLMGLVFGLMAVALVGRMLLRFSGGGNRRAVPILLIGAGVALIGQIGFWGGRILQAWISRQRECLADASAVQFTRNPDGLRDALIRVAALDAPPRRTAAGMEEMAHMLFVPGVQRWLATHPPLLERVQELDPNVTQAQFESMVRRAQALWREAAAAGAGAEETPESSGAPMGVTVPAAAQLIAASAGGPAPQHLEQAVALRQALPESLRASAEAPDRAAALVLQIVRGTGAAQSLPPLLRLPAVLQLFPALRALPRAEQLHLCGELDELVRADGRISVFEYSLQKLLRRALDPPLAMRAPHGSLSLDQCAPQLGVVFAVLARHGARDAEQARRAYEAGIAPLLPRERPAYGVIDDWAPLFDRSLDELCALSIAAKQLLIEGLVRTIAHDGLLAPEEAELLRAICATLECPLPPVLPPAAA